MNIACFLVTEGKFKKVIIPEALFSELAKAIRDKGTEIVHLNSGSYEVEGLYVPGRGRKTKMMLISDGEQNKEGEG